jgi:hypothetical protein
LPNIATLSEPTVFLTFNICGMIGYITGEIRCLDMCIDLRGANNWAYNDQIMQQTIRNNVDCNQKIHCTRAAMVQEMWRNLKAIYQSQGVQT